MSTQILAIDPGTRESGYVVWDGAKVFESGVICNESLLAAIPGHLARGVDILAIEQIGHCGLGMVARNEMSIHRAGLDVACKSRYVTVSENALKRGPFSAMLETNLPFSVTTAKARDNEYCWMN